MIIQDGQYKTISRFLEYLPMESEQGYIRVVKPLSWASNEPKYTPMVLLLPGFCNSPLSFIGTGEKRYGRRYDGVSIPLARMGIGSIVLLLSSSHLDHGRSLLRSAQTKAAEWLQVAARVGSSSSGRRDDRGGTVASLLLHGGGIRTVGCGRHQHGRTACRHGRRVDAVSRGNRLAGRTSVRRSRVHFGWKGDGE